MSKIIALIAKETAGDSFNTNKFCYEGVEVPKLEYDDYQTLELKAYGEKTHYTTSIDLSEKSKKVYKNTSPIFKFFLDGSRKTYKIDDIKYENQIYPIICGQSGVGCTFRLNYHEFKKQHLRIRLLVSLPDIADKDDDGKLFFNNLRTKINNLDVLKKRQLEVDEILTYSSKKAPEGTVNYENRAIAKIHEDMVESEQLTVKQLVQQRLLNESSYLIKDGSLEYNLTGITNSRDLISFRNNYRWVVGVSKKFNPENFSTSRERNNASALAELPLFHRTPAYRYTNMYHENKDPENAIEYAIWYVRIRDYKYTASPFDGVVKVEKLIVTDDEIANGIESEEIDLISANIINERNPVCYGSDDRWANHLYPVYLTERLIKSNYLSDFHFLNIF